MVNKVTKDSRDYLLRDLPREVTDKLKVAALLHRSTMKDYLVEILRKHIEDLERRGITLTLPKGKT